MGYYMEQIGQDFTIFAEDKSKAFEALKRWEKEQISSYSYPLIFFRLGMLPHWKNLWKNWIGKQKRMIVGTLLVFGLEERSCTMKIYGLMR